MNERMQSESYEHTHTNFLRYLYAQLYVQSKIIYIEIRDTHEIMHVTLYIEGLMMFK